MSIFDRLAISWDFRVANLMGLNALSLVLFFCVYFSKHQHHKVYGYWAVFLFTALNNLFFLTVNPESKTYGYVIGSMYVELAIVYGMICLTIYLWRKYRQRQSSIDKAIPTVLTPPFTESLVAELCNRHLRDHRFPTNVSLSIQRKQGEIGSSFESDWMIIVKDDDFDYSDIDCSPFVIYINENPLQIWHNDGKM